MKRVIVESPWTRALEKAKADGHVMKDDPVFFGNVRRQSCVLCGGAILERANGRGVYGSIVEGNSRCPEEGKGDADTVYAVLAEGMRVERDEARARVAELEAALDKGGWRIEKTSCHCNREDEGHGWAVLFEDRMVGCLGCLRDSSGELAAIRLAKRSGG